MTQSIFTRYYGPTTTRAACIRAWASGNPNKKIRLSIDPEKTTDAMHMEAARTLAEANKWPGAWVEGALSDGGYVYVQVNDMRHSFVAGNAAREPHRLPPDPDEQNDDRAEWADAALEAFRNTTGTDHDDALYDLLCDLMHWCDRRTYEDEESPRHGLRFDFEEELRKARSNYRDETAGE